MKIFENRKQMLKHFTDQIGNADILEIGVFKGEFLDFLVNDCLHKIVDGVDLFSGCVGSGDHDGNNMSHQDMEIKYEELKKKYENDSLINLYKSYSSDYLIDCEDCKYDIIYIDADHSYLGVKRDIELSYHKIKNGGFIMGHDYELNMNKCRTRWEFGTKQAVDEFCEKYNQKIICKATDGCVSFCIQVSK
tara:strand:- start:6965 stop:7537 length:573 start_codon:yes stop_codon:yes gene_type:complete